MRRVIGKMHARKATSRVFADAWALWRAAGGKVSLAPPVGYIGSIGLTLQERVRGERLGGMVDQPGFPNRVRTTARMLAGMHALSVPLSTRRKPSEEAEGVYRWSGVLTAIRSDLAPRIEQLRNRIASEVESRAVLSAPIHADFHHTNVLVDGDHITIIDLDEMAFGDPMVDVGRFLASLRVPARRAFGDISALDEAGGAFLDEYMARAGGDEQRARLFEAAALLIAAGSSFRIQRPNWEEEVSLLIAESEKKLEASTATVVSGTGNIRQAALSKEEQRAWATDGMYMQAMLDPHVRKTYDAELTRCRVTKRRSEDRVRYTLKGFQNGERWSVPVEGIAWKGRTAMERLLHLRSALDGTPHAPLLPRPVAYFRTLSLLVWEPPSGTRFSRLLEGGDGAKAAGDVARALAALHRAPVDLQNRRSLGRELRSLRDRLDRLSKASPALASRTDSLYSEIEERTRAVPRRLGPIVRTVHPHHVLCGEGQIALDKVEDIVLSHPFLDVADFLARVALLGITREVKGAVGAAENFKGVYRTETEDGNGIGAFEAAALLRLACIQAGRDPHGDLAERLLEKAESALAG
jgi:aminoglycoside phosphotransferase (APT) family kinase protein